MNGEEERVLNGIRYGLREEVPKNTEELRKQNILKAISLDMELELGVFTKDEVKDIVSDIKDKYINNSNVKIKKK